LAAARAGQHASARRLKRAVRLEFSGTVDTRPQHPQDLGMRILAGMGAVATVLVAAACSVANSAPDPILIGGVGAGTSIGTPTCAAPASLCGNACVDLSRNALHCGECGKACKKGQGLQIGESCIQSKCQVAVVCGGGSEKCGDSCADVKTDPFHCGSCTNACPAAATGQVALCVDGQCQVTCKDPLRDCDNNSANGCEVDVSKDQQNCGFCGAKCPATAPNAAPVCMNGCQANCAQGYNDCNNDLTDGCEAKIVDDVKNCGQCGKACDTSKEQCVGGQCVVQQFNWNILDKKDIVYNGIPYLLLKLKYKSQDSFSQNWCQDYTNLCASFGFVPTGCDGPMYGGSYLNCVNTYKSNGQGNTLSCNPSGGVMNAAKQNGYGDATFTNSFGFHTCIDNQPGSCTKTMCSGNNCNNALSYFDFAQPFGYTLCRK
jgi:hypothetical protein